ncbi:MAG: AbrB/MazE/SpoVT family DNA-binding domain-containing protein [Armatimonadetes bacterium]|nr:AbrB/MazE/SpoVT family DNA-binding domain-containing protein [Armatimonadota bacterium]
MSNTVGLEGQITIEADIRRVLGIRPGWRAIQAVEDGKLVIRFSPPRHTRSLAGILRNATTVRIETEEEFSAAAEAHGPARSRWLVGRRVARSEYRYAAARAGRLHATVLCISTRFVLSILA